MDDIGKPRRDNLPKTIGDKIRTLIAGGVLTPGMQLRQMDLAEQFGTSRVPLREALKRLAAEGVVEHDQNKGFFVARLSLAEAEQLYRIRYLLEAEALNSVEWPDEQQLEALNRKADELERVKRAKDSLKWLALHREFFEMVFELSPNKLLVREIMRFIGLTDRYRGWAPYVWEQKTPTVTLERQLVDALTRQDRKRLLRVFKDYRAAIEESLLESLRSRGL